MICVRWALSALLDLALLVPFLLLAPLLSLFTGGGWPSWGGWFWTHDNPPHGDPKFAAACWFPGVTSGAKGWANRVQWLWRNPLYGLARRLGVEFVGGMVATVGDTKASDRRGVAGSYFSRYIVDGEVLAFEYYLIKPWGAGRCLRMRLGWKITTARFAGHQKYGIHVISINPFASFG